MVTLHLCLQEFQGQWTYSCLSWLLALLPLQRSLLGLTVTWSLVSTCAGCWISFFEEHFKCFLYHNMPQEGLGKAWSFTQFWLCWNVQLLLTGHCACSLSLDQSSLLFRFSFVVHKTSLTNHLLKTLQPSITQSKDGKWFFFRCQFQVISGGRLKCGLSEV